MLVNWAFETKVLKRLSLSWRKSGRKEKKIKMEEEKEEGDEKLLPFHILSEKENVRETQRWNSVSPLVEKWRHGGRQGGKHGREGGREGWEEGRVKMKEKGEDEEVL